MADVGEGNSHVEGAALCAERQGSTRQPMVCNVAKDGYG